jgi:glycosyltransferase involved in cell wall biosynthesis
LKISVITPTHNSHYLDQVWYSLKAQTHQDFEWVIVPNGDCPPIHAESFDRDPRVVLWRLPYRIGKQIGAIKGLAFQRGTGDVLLELDHDDLLHPLALEKCAQAFEDPDVDFVYSDWADFSDPPGLPVTYHSNEAKAGWVLDGWRFGECEVPSAYVPFVKRARLSHPVGFEPSALALSQIYHSPNHFRAWRASFYKKDGHDFSLALADDHELLIRTYLNGRMKRIPEVLYFYRVAGQNTWASNVDRIRQFSEEHRSKYLHRLVVREMTLRGLPCLDLGGAHNSPGAPWIPFDKSLPWPDEVPHRIAGCPMDFRKTVLNSGTWPFPDSSIGAFRAHDFLEHLPDKLATMREIHRCLAPGGWLLASTPDAMGPGAHQDPTHVSFWVENSFRYYTEQRLAKYIGNSTERFMASRLFTAPGQIPYVIADLVSLKDDDGRLPGHRRI